METLDTKAESVCDVFVLHTAVFGEMKLFAVVDASYSPFDLNLA